MLFDWSLFFLNKKVFLQSQCNKLNLCYKAKNLCMSYLLFVFFTIAHKAVLFFYCLFCCLKIICIKLKTGSCTFYVGKTLGCFFNTNLGTNYIVDTIISSLPLQHCTIYYTNYVWDGIIAFDLDLSC